MIKIPPYLKKGDTIGLTCPAGYMATAKAQACISTLQSWGFDVKIGESIGKRNFTFGGTDEERRKDFQKMTVMLLQ